MYVCMTCNSSPRVESSRGRCSYVVCTITIRQQGTPVYSLFNIISYTISLTEVSLNQGINLLSTPQALFLCLKIINQRYDSWEPSVYTHSDLLGLNLHDSWLAIQDSHIYLDIYICAKQDKTTQ